MLLAAGKPLLGITEPGSEVDRAINEERVGWTVAPGAVKALVEVIRKAANNRDELVAMGKRARQAATSKYSLDAALESYRNALGVEAAPETRT